MRKVIIPSSSLPSTKEQIKEIQRILLQRILEELAKGPLERNGLEQLKVALSIEKDLSDEEDEDETNPLEKAKTEKLLKILNKSS